MSGHADVLRQLFPLAPGGDFEAEADIEGSHLDDALASAQLLLVEAFPDTADELLADWERVYSLVAGELTDEERRAAVLSKVRERGGLTIDYFVCLAAARGYTVTIAEGDAGTPFRAGLSQAGMPVYDIEEQWTWTVTVHGEAGPLPAFEAYIADLAPAWTEVDFAYDP